MTPVIRHLETSSTLGMTTCCCVNVRGEPTPDKRCMHVLLSSTATCFCPNAYHPLGSRTKRLNVTFQPSPHNIEGLI